MPAWRKRPNGSPPASLWVMDTPVVAVPSSARQMVVAVGDISLHPLSEIDFAPNTAHVGIAYVGRGPSSYSDISLKVGGSSCAPI